MSEHDLEPEEGKKKNYETFDLYKVAAQGRIATVVTGHWTINRYQITASEYDPRTFVSKGVWKTWLPIPLMVHASRMIPFILLRPAPNAPGQGKVLFDYFGGSGDGNGGYIGRQTKLERDDPEGKFTKSPWRLSITEGAGTKDQNGAIKIKPSAVKKSFNIRFSDQHAGELFAAISIDAVAGGSRWLQGLYEETQKKRAKRGR